MPADRLSAAGLCERCRNARIVRTPRSSFWLCGLSRDDARFERYPRLPVRECPGYAALPEGETPPESRSGRGPQG